MKGLARVVISIMLVVLSLSAWSVSNALGQTVDQRTVKPKFGIGVQPIGLSINPDQYVFGVQGILGKFKALQFTPSVDFGFGDNVTLTMVNLDLILNVFSPPKTSAILYIGAGEGISIVKPKDLESDTEAGLNLLAGLKLPFGTNDYYNVESRFGIGDIPDFKLLFGVMFGLGIND